MEITLEDIKDLEVTTVARARSDRSKRNSDLLLSDAKAPLRRSSLLN